MAKNKKRKVPEAKKPPRPKPTAVLPVPFAWHVSKWDQVAPHVPPHSTRAGKHLVRCHRDELVACGALTRNGRELILNGAAYCAWMFSDAHKKAVADYELAMNKKETQS